MQNLMRNSMVHLVKLFRLGKKIMSKDADVSVLLKINFFTDSVLSVEVQKWWLLLEIV